MLSEGHHREAAVWAAPFMLTAADIIRVDGPEDAQNLAAGRQCQLLADLEMSSSAELDPRFAQMAELGAQTFWLIGELVRDNPEVESGVKAV